MEPCFIQYAHYTSEMQSSDAVIVPATYEILNGLPGTGPYPEQFSSDGRGTFREGLVIRFHPSNGEPWVGNFQYGDSGMTGALKHPDGRTVIAIARGTAYHVDPNTRQLIRTIGFTIGNVVASSANQLVVLSDCTTLWLVHADGRIHESERISWNDPMDLGIGERHVFGIASDFDYEEGLPFAVDIETGKVTGGIMDLPLVRSRKHKHRAMDRLALVSLRFRYAFRLLVVVGLLCALIWMLARF